MLTVSPHLPPHHRNPFVSLPANTELFTETQTYNLTASSTAQPLEMWGSFRENCFHSFSNFLLEVASITWLMAPYHTDLTSISLVTFTSQILTLLPPS
jgi:hypothetical protein